MIENIGPILSVTDLDATLAYLTTKLGFQVDWSEPGGAGVSRGGKGFMVIPNQGAKGAYIWMGVQDARAIFDEYRAAGAIIRDAPLNYPWALEFKVEDLDGNVFRVGSNPEDRAFDEWHD